MLDDRPPRRAVDVDEHNDAEEMEVQASFHEAALVVLANQPRAKLATVADVEPWLRVRSETYVSCDVTLILDEDDGA